MAPALTTSMLCPILVCRDAETAALGRLIEIAHAGHGRAVLISDEAGGGKSRLVAEAKAAATRRHLPDAGHRGLQPAPREPGAPAGADPFTYSTTHCMTVSLAQGGEGLGMMWGEQAARRLLAEAGFTLHAIEQVPGDIFNNYYVCGR